MARDVFVRWVDNKQMLGFDGEGHHVLMDTPIEIGGENTGATPIELVLYGLAGCTMLDVVSILQKKRQPLLGVQAKVGGTRRQDGPPSPFETIQIEYLIKGDVDPQAIEKAIDLAVEKYCSVKAMFADDVEVTTSYRIVDAF